MKNRISLSRDLCARFLLVAAGLSLAVVACDDSEDRRELEDTGGSGGSTAGSGGKSGGSSGSAGKGGSSAGSMNNAGAGGEPTPEGGSAGAPVGGGGGDDAGGAGGDAQGGGAGEGGQGGAGSDALSLFADDYGSGIGFVAFGGGSINDLSVDATTAHSGAASLKIQVPAVGYTGGSLVSSTDRDLSEFNAVSFWAKASVATHALDKVGLGNDAAGGGPLTVERFGLALTTAWQHFVVPVPSPSKFAAESGLFHFAEAQGAAYTIWLDDIEYVTADNLGTPVPRITTGARSVTIGSPFPMPQAFVDYTIDAVPFTLTVSAPWFDYDSLDEAVASVTAGVVTPIAVGTTEITGELDAVVATGKITVNVAEVTIPAVAAPTPTNLPADVISLFSNAFTNVTVDTWSASWDDILTTVADVQIASNATKLYTLASGSNFAGIEFTSAPIDATLMTHFHVDVWMPSATVFRVKLVDFGANGVYNGVGSDDSDFEIAKPGLTPMAWQSLEFPLADFTGLAARAHLAQMVISSEAGATIYLDNLYFHK